VTEATATRRDKTVKTLVNVAQIAGVTNPELANAALNTALLNMDGEGMQDLQDWLRKQMVAQGLIKPTEEEAQQLAEAQANQQPSAQDQALQAVAEKESALAQKAIADTELSGAKVGLTEAQTVKTLAEAQGAGVNAAHTRVLTDKEARTPIEPPRNPALEKATNG
jgi:hypothetical protein